ncbi:MAG: DUF624 domain-containing protein [Ruminococcus flavefaciens]|nr:DUF624 domain-containing protein [Ruminococcus flavefaciens]
MAIFSNDFESRGSGIAKNAPKKKGIRLFFEIFFRKFWKLIEVNMLYFVFFIPVFLMLASLAFIKNNTVSLICAGLSLVLFVVCIGPATAGMTKVMRKFVLEKHSFIVNDFFKAFKANFKKACLVGFVDCVIILSVYASFIVYPVLAEKAETNLMYIPMVITFSLAIVIAMMNFYIFLMMTATNLSFINLVKNSFALAFVALKQNVITFIINATAIVGMFLLYVYMRPLFLMLIPFAPMAFLCFITCFNSYPVIQKFVINPYYTSIGEINPELMNESPTEEKPVFEDMGGKEKPIEKRKKGKGKRIS